MAHTDPRPRNSAHLSPHVITYMVAAGYDLPYIQAQVGHLHPTTTLAIYAQLMARRDRDQLRAEIRELLGVEPERAEKSLTSSLRTSHTERGGAHLRAAEKAGKGRTPHR